VRQLTTQVKPKATPKPSKTAADKRQMLQGVLPFVPPQAGPAKRAGEYIKGH
jgi:hypothetical protein